MRRRGCIAGDHEPDNLAICVEFGFSYARIGWWGLLLARFANSVLSGRVQSAHLHHPVAGKRRSARPEASAFVQARRRREAKQGASRLPRPDQGDLG